MSASNTCMQPIKGNMKTSIGLGFLLLLLLYCFSLEPLSFEVALQKEQLATLEASPHQFTLKVPINHAFYSTKDRITIDLNPNGRRIKQLVISKKKARKDSVSYEDKYRFKNGGILRYSLSTKEGGSAGPEYVLNGQLLFSDVIYLIEASEQKEWGKGDPEFCLKYLSTLKEK